MTETQIPKGDEEMIKSIRIRHFKSIDDVTVELSPVTVLVGRSGTGKSNFVKAIRTLRDILLSSGNTSGWDTSAALPVFVDAARPLFDVTFSVGGVSDVFRYQLDFAPSSNRRGSCRLQSESLFLGNELLFHQQASTDQAYQPSQYEWIKEPATTIDGELGNPVLGRMPAYEEAVVAYTALTTGIGCYEFPMSVMTTEGRSDRRDVTSGLDDAGSNYVSIAHQLSTNLQTLDVRRAITASLRHINPTIASVEPNSVTNPTHLVVGHFLGNKRIPLHLGYESDGFRRYYAHLLALYQQPPKQTLIFEHPEDGIYPGALSLLADEMLTAPGAGRGQVLLTTHSPGLLDHFAPDQIRVVELNDWRTTIGSIAEEQRQSIEENLYTSGELLTVDPARSGPPEVISG